MASRTPAILKHTEATMRTALGSPQRATGAFAAVELAIVAHSAGDNLAANRKDLLGGQFDSPDVRTLVGESLLNVGFF